MPKPRICVLRAPGTNCDEETAFAFESVGGLPERLHLFRLLESPQKLLDFQILCIPGGFSYGDDIGAGVVFGSHLSGKLAGTIKDFLQQDRLVLGICNGFQVLVKSRILPDANPTDDSYPPPATLTWNLNGKYTALWTHLQSCSPKNVFLRGIDRLELPIAHAEGRLIPRSPDLIESWRKAGQIALCYAAPDPTAAQNSCAADLLPYPRNPNGSTANIAGLGDPSGRVLGLMPHPERFLDATQHPQWTRRRLTGEGAGRQIFRNAINYFG